MISSINSIDFKPQVCIYSNKVSCKSLYATNVSDSVQFTGKSLASEYKTVFDYLASNILARNKYFQVNGSLLSATKVNEALKNLFEKSGVYNKFDLCDYRKIKWKSYIPQDVRENSVDKINQARLFRLNEWAEILDKPASILNGNKALSQKLNENNSLKLVIWDAVTSELKADNRHIPVPYNSKALLESIERFEAILPKDRVVTCAKPSFIEYYTHRLRDNLLMDMGLSNSESVWVKIPSIKHEPNNIAGNIAKLETLSNRNWCTRSSVDKAREALTDGDFYIYLKRNKSSKMWEPVTGMTTLKGKIDQIQGKENDNIVPLNLLPEIKKFISSEKLKCASGIVDEGPRATQALLISEKLNEKDSSGLKNFAKAIKDGDTKDVLEFLHLKPEYLKNGLLKIKTYKPFYNFDSERGYVVPFSMFGINENDLLRHVEIIDGDFILFHKNPLYSSTISEFPPNLKSVTGKIICSKVQFEIFKHDILRIVKGNKNRVYISSGK